MEVDALHTTSSVIDFKAMAEAQSNDLSQEGGAQSLTLSRIPVPTCDASLLCDTSTGTPRPLVLPQFRRQVFDALHSLSHPGVRATRRLVTSRYVWPGINKDVHDWTRTCLQCQQAKVHQHTSTPIGQFLPPDARFAHVHIDLVGPLPSCQGFTYLFTCVDRFTRWPEVVPLMDMTATSMAHAFLTGWIARFGVPTFITTDRGSQFESDLWQQLMCLLGSTRIRTTAYHPAANGLVERFQRQLKASLMSVTTSTRWVEALPMVLLVIRTSVKEDLGCCTAELVYGTTLRIPGQFFDPVEEIPDPLSFVSRLRTTLQQIQAKQPRHHTNRRDAVRHPLQPPYDGPFMVHCRYPKFFTIIGSTGKPQTISVDRLKPAHTDNHCLHPISASILNSARILINTSIFISPASPPAAAPQVVRTRHSGRRVHWPDQLVF